MLRKVVTSLLLVLAFMVMASVFTPDFSRAGAPRQRFPGVPPKPVDAMSADAHLGLRSMGVIEDLKFTVHIYATDLGPRYTIREVASGTEVGTLLSLEQVQRFFPELRLPQLEMAGESPLMMVDPSGGNWRP